MPRAGKVLVVGTTTDYVDWIRAAAPGKALFLTDPVIRRAGKEAVPAHDEEILCCLEDADPVLRALEAHLDRYDQKIIGVACFDCESMVLASILAGEKKVAYPSVEAICNARDKYVSKQIWQAHGIACPRVFPVNTREEVLAFFQETGRKGIVLKPFSASGSELVFRCQTPGECEASFDILARGLQKQSSHPLFKKVSSLGHEMLAEEMIEGPEYSCDLIVENGHATVIRLTRKIKPGDKPFGTIQGYVLTADLPGRFDVARLEKMLFQAASTLGIHRGICMVDFILKEDQPVLIELTPRPGGDCLPFMLREAGHFDILEAALDFAAKKPVVLVDRHQFSSCIGFRLHAPRAGILKGIDTDQLAFDPRIKKIHIIRKPGHGITLPPEDYDSWYLGHLIICPGKDNCPETECVLISNRISIEIEAA